MGNCALKPKVLSETGAPAPEELKDSLLEDQKIDAAKSLSNLFLQDKAEKQTKEDEKITPEKIPVTEDLKTALVKEKALATEKKAQLTETKAQIPESKAPVTETKVQVTETESPVTETKLPVMETKVLADDQQIMFVLNIKMQTLDSLYELKRQICQSTKMSMKENSNARLFICVL
ncbi:unnamed protein product [Arabis nemorensis]|uniref:Uncharacterized protein n=1 Tax=Arabis nemorensis TaxID=586526 RepID=A0A565C7R3_9BRAS|nr:unnamed protein product [Arabis nemorensis]